MKKAYRNPEMRVSEFMSESIVTVASGTKTSVESIADNVYAKKSVTFTEMTAWTF